MSSTTIKKAAIALKIKNGESKRYRVTFQETIDHAINVDAVDNEHAVDLAWDKWGNGERNQIGDNTDIIDTEIL